MEFKVLPPLLREDSVLSEADKESLMGIYDKLWHSSWEMHAGAGELDPERLRRSEITYGEIQEQPAKIAETVNDEKENIAAVAKKLCETPIDKIIMLGCGDSIAAVRGTKYFLETLLKIDCDICESYDFNYYYNRLVTPNTLVICLSSSGKTIRVIESIMVAKALGAKTLVLTNTLESPLNAIASTSLYIHAQRQGWPTQSSTSAMAMVIALAFELAGNLGTADQAFIEKTEAEFMAIPDLMKAAIRLSEDWAKSRARELATQDFSVFAGGGPYFTCAEFGAAKVKECTTARAIAINLEEFHHYITAKAGDSIFVIAPKGATTARALDTVYGGHMMEAKVHIITNVSEMELAKEADSAVFVPETSEFFANFLCSVPVQMLGFYLSKERERLARLAEEA